MSNLETFMKPSAIATQSFFSAYQNQNQKKKKFGHQKTHRLVLNQGPYPRISSKMAIFAMTSFMGRILHIYFFLDIICCDQTALKHSIIAWKNVFEMRQILVTVVKDICHHYWSTIDVCSRHWASASVDIQFVLWAHNTTFQKITIRKKNIKSKDSNFAFTNRVVARQLHLELEH